MKPEAASVAIRKGACHILYAYDIGISTNLAKCLDRAPLLGGRTTLSNRNRRAPKYFGYDPQPLTIIQESDVPRIGAHRLSPAVALTFYDFGAVSISYEIAISGTLGDLRDLSIEIDGSDALRADSRRRAQDIIRALGDAVEHPAVADPVEDYLIFEIDDFDLCGPADTVPERAGGILAQILRAESQVLSESETSDALACRISYGPGDITIIDWNAAMIFDREADDVQSVLEFANTELLELRFLDYRLDSSIDRSYELSSQPNSLFRLLPGYTARNIRRISQMQLEGAILFERVSNAPKLLGDQFLARVYRLASQRFHVSEWNASILRKLDTIEDFHKQVHDTAASQRLELLEWIIIILIFFEIILPFLPKVLPFSP
jgi:hypothetical protein